MKLALGSDLHLEFGQLDLHDQPDADVLILSGDIFVANDFDKASPDPEAPKSTYRERSIRYREFLEQATQKYAHVIYVAGNHEFYHGKWNASLKQLQDICAEYANVIMLENSSVILNDITFVGGTLWTDMNKRDPMTLMEVEERMNDFRLIRDDLSRGFRKLNPRQTVTRHEKTLEYIKRTLDAKVTEKYVVVGHHAPSFGSTHPKYKDQYLMNGAYCSDLSDFILDHPEIKLWTHGHTHEPFHYMIGSTTIACNPRGYVNYERGLQQEDPYYFQQIEV
jgi:3',5'-cyclic AMP phosphodiesterase CpdA